MASNRRRRYSSSSDEETKETVNIKSKGAKNVFKNDGSFMEMFKKLEQEKKNEPEIVIVPSAPLPPLPSNETGEENRSDVAKKPVSFVGKRQGGRLLKVGVVKKNKKPEPADEQDTSGKGDAWTKYMSEVKKYRGNTCEEDNNRRPLVK